MTENVFGMRRCIQPTCPQSPGPPVIEPGALPEPTLCPGFHPLGSEGSGLLPPTSWPCVRWKSTPEPGRWEALKTPQFSQMAETKQ